MNKLRTGIMFTLFSVLSNSVTPVLNKFALIHITPTSAAFLNSAVSMIVTGLIVAAQRKKLAVNRFRPFLVIACCHALGLILLYTSLNLLDPTTVALLGRFYIVFALLLGAVVLRESLPGKDWVMFIIAALGSFLFLYRHGLGSVSIAGVAAAIAFTFFFALENFLCKRLIHDCSIFLISFIVNSMAFAVIGVYTLLRTPHFSVLSAGGLHFDSWMYVALSAIASIVAINSALLALRYIDFSRASALRAFGPLFTAAISLFFFPVELSPTNWFGGALIIFAFTCIPIIDRWVIRRQEPAVVKC